MPAAVAAIALFSTTAFAQNAQPVSAANNPAECCQLQGAKPCPEQMQMLMFDGIQLTDAQKAQLKAIPTPGKKQADRQQKAREERAKQRKADRLEYLASVKAILTPEQYVQFLENSFVNAPAKRGAKHHKGNVKKDDRRGNKQRPANDGAPRK